MFPRRAKQTARPSPSADEQPTAAGPDPRDATIARLEQELAEQRDAAKTLRESLDAATFKIEILEKSYAKQLAEVRDKRAALEEELKEKNEILANLGGPHEHTLRELNDALTVIKVLKKERDQLRKQVAEGGFRQPKSKAHALLDPADHKSFAEPASSIDDTGSGTINALIANAGWVEKKSAVGTGQATALVEAEPEPPPQDMLSPDLVFSAKDKESDEA